MHLDVETLERALHDELDSAARATVTDHLASCLACAERLAEAGRDEHRLFDLLEELDQEPLAIDWGAVTRESRSGGSARSLIAASVAFLLVATGILYAIPGSPLRAWFDAVVREDPEVVAPAAVPEDPALSGIAVEPADPFEVGFMASQRTGQIRIMLVLSKRLELRVVGETVGLESGVDRLLISNEGSGSSYELLVPRSLGSMRVRVGEMTVFDKQGENIRTPRSPDSTGTYTIDLAAASP
jgi:hypothetical protein